MNNNNKFIIACVNLGIELQDKNEEMLTKREKQFLNALDKLTDRVLEDNKKSKGSVYNITFENPYIFREKAYCGIDISSIEYLSKEQFVEVENSYSSETALEWACRVASKVTNIPLEFFTGLPASEGIKIKEAIQYNIINRI